MALSGTPPLLPAFLRAAEAVWQACHDLAPGFSVEVLEQATSTNTLLLERSRGGEPCATLLVALEQTAGRGRRGNTWRSYPGRSLTFSLAWPLRPTSSRPSLAGLSLVVGAVLAQSLHPEVMVKWPNDLCVKMRDAWCKLGGILIETVQHRTAWTAVIGVGLNVLSPPEPGPLEAAAWPQALPAIGLDALWPDVDPAGVLVRLAHPLCQALRAFEVEGFAAWRAPYAQRDLLRGHPIDVLEPGGPAPWRGMARGVDDQGALIVHTAQGERHVSVGEVSVRLGPDARTV